MSLTSYKKKTQKRSKNDLKNKVSSLLSVSEFMVLFLSFSKNNIRADISSIDGQILFWKTGGNCGFKSRKKSTSFAAKVVTENLLTFFENYGIKKLIVKIENFHNISEEMLNTLTKAGLYIKSISIVDAIQFNGVRARGARRV